MLVGRPHSKTPRALAAPLRSHARELAFILKLFPMLPSGVVDLLTKPPRIETMRYRTRSGESTAKVYLPAAPGRYPAQLLCLGVVPFGVDHPQVPRLGEALARSGIVALIHWSDAMRDRRLAPEDVEDLVLAYASLIDRDDVDPERSGLFGTCVGGSFALLAAAHALIRDRVRYVGAFAPYSSMWTLARDVASRTREVAGRLEPWEVDPLTGDVYARTIARLLRPDVAAGLLAAHDRPSAEAALAALPDAAREQFDAMSPLAHIQDIHAPCIVVGHDRDDLVLPVAESRQLAAALAGRPGFKFTEYAMFQHADPTKRRLSPPALLRELSRFYASVHPIFAATA